MIMTITHFTPKTHRHALTACSLASLTALAAYGCQYPERDLGRTDRALTSPPSAPVEQAELVTDFAGTWEGSMDDALGIAADGSSPSVYAFPSGSTRLRLEIGFQDGFFFSSLIFGDAEPPPPPIDPSVGYPPDPSFRFNGIFDTYNVPPFEGFTYNVDLDFDPSDVGRLDINPNESTDFWLQRPAVDGKLELAFTLDEPFAPWCELQTDGLCNSITSIGWVGDNTNECFVSDGEESRAIDCQKAVICGGEHCRNEHRSTLTLRFSRDGLTGAFNELPLHNERGFRTRPGTVRFQRVDAEPAVGR